GTHGQHQHEQHREAGHRAPAGILDETESVAHGAGEAERQPEAQYPHEQRHHFTQEAAHQADEGREEDDPKDGVIRPGHARPAVGAPLARSVGRLFYQRRQTPALASSTVQLLGTTSALPPVAAITVFTALSASARWT